MIWQGGKNSLWANLPGVSGAAAPRSLIVRGGVYAAGGTIFAAGSLPTRAKIVSLQICRPEIPGDAKLVL